MINLFSEVHDKIGESDQDDISKVNTDLISRIIKEKIKPGKGDPEFEFTTDAMKNGPIELSEHLATFLQSCLIHGYISCTPHLRYSASGEGS